MRGNRICVIDNESVEIRAIMWVLIRLGDGYVIESEVRLSEQTEEEIICQNREIRIVCILSRGRNQFTSDIEFDIYINVCIVIGTYNNSKLFWWAG